ncbi:MAG TPA: NTP transferase domain-containing protein [bacterium]|jgi:molybdopterin-guanine dinucleotide biosynthesis protein A
MNEPSSLWPHTGAILIGADYRYSGSAPQGKPMWDGKIMLEHVLRPLLSVCRSVVIVGDGGVPLPQDERIRQIEDPHPQRSLLSSLEVLLASTLDSGYLVATCNQPFMTIPLLRQLIEAHPSVAHLFLVPRGTSFHPFPGYYPASLLEDVRQTLKSDCPSLRHLTRQCPPIWVPLSQMEENHLLTVNPPAQLERLQQLAGHNNISI